MNISSPADLQMFAARVNAGEVTLDGSLIADIDLSGIRDWVPIGNTTARAYKGAFDGAGHIISNLHAGIGLFHAIAGATIQNVKLLGFNITYEDRWIQSGTTGCCGFIAAYNTSNYPDVIQNIEIQHCSMFVPPSSSNNVVTGAIIGRFYPAEIITDINIIDCDIRLDTTAGSWEYCGGVLGQAFTNDAAGTISAILANVIIAGTKLQTTGYGGIMISTIAARPVDHTLYIQNTAVLKSVIIKSGTSANVHRINGYDNSGRGISRNYNYVSSDTAANFAVTSDITGRDGLTKPAAEMTKSFFASAANWDAEHPWDFENTWYWDDFENIPKLQAFRRPVQMGYAPAGNAITPLQIRLGSRSGWHGDTAEVESAANADYSAELMTRITRGKREISFEIPIQAPDAVTLRDAVDDICGMFQAQEQPGRLVVNDRYCHVYPTKAPEITDVTDTFAWAKITLIATNPYWYSAAPAKTYSSGAVIYNAGQHPAEIEMTASADTITLTVGGTVTHTIKSRSGYHLNGCKIIITDSSISITAAGANAMHRAEIDSQFFLLPTGASVITGANNITIKERYNNP